MSWPPGGGSRFITKRKDWHWKSTLSPNSLYGYRVTIGYCVPVKGGRVSPSSFPHGLRGWGSHSCFGFHGRRLSSLADELRSGLTLAWGSSLVLRRSWGYVGKLNSVWRLVFGNWLFGYFANIPERLPGTAYCTSESWCESGVWGGRPVVFGVLG
jgi:hypothetical protein